MKQFYTFGLLLFALLFPFSMKADGDAVPVTLNIDDPTHVIVSVAYEVVEDLVAGDNLLSVPAWTDIVIAPADGYLLGKVTKNGVVQSNALTRFYTYASPYDDPAAVYSITTITAAEYYSSTFTVTIDDPEAVSLQFQPSYRTVAGATAGEPWTVAYNSETETMLSIRYNGSGALYQVSADGEPVTSYDNNSTFNITLAEGMDIDVKANFPEGSVVPVSFVFVNADTEGCVTGVEVGYDSYTPDEFLKEDFEVPMGKSVKVSFNFADYNISSIYLNDEKQYVYNTLSFTPLSPAVVTVDASAYKVVDKTVHVEGAEHMTMYKGYSWANEIVELVDGDNVVTFSEKDSYYTFKVDGGYEFTVFQDDDEDLLSSYSEYNNGFYLKSTGDLTIKVSKIYYPYTAYIYLDTLPASAFVSLTDYQRSVYRSYEPKEGYNEIGFKADMTPFSLSANLYTGGDFATNCVYVNGEKLAPIYEGGSSYELNIADGDIVKAYFNEAPAEHTVNFTVDEGYAPVVTYDIIKTHDDLSAPLKAMTGTLVKVEAPEGVDDLEIKIGEGESEILESKEFTVNADTEVVISKKSGVSNVTVAGAKAGAVYNLQGIRVADAADFDRLPAGVYIIDGVKTYKK